MFDYSTIPEAFRRYPNFVMFKTKWDSNEQKWTKFVCHPEGYKVNGLDPENWLTYDEAIELYNYKGDFYAGIGFVFDKTDLLFIDFDGVIDLKGDADNDEALKILEELQPFCELSHSGKGLHAFVRVDKDRLPQIGSNNNGGKSPLSKIFNKDKKKFERWLECYKQRRFCALTGNLVPGFPVAVPERTEESIRFVEKWYPQELYAPSNEPRATAGLIADKDAETVLEEALKDRRTRSLFDGDWESLGHPSQSEADHELCGILAYWFDDDAVMIEQMFNRSGLVRDKWSKRTDYRKLQIEAGIAMNWKPWYMVTNPETLETKQRSMTDSLLTKLKNKSYRNPVTPEGYVKPEKSPDPEDHGEDYVEDDFGFHAERVSFTGEQTDAGNAKRLLSCHGQDMFFSTGDSQWYVWTGNRWMQDESGAVHRIAEMKADQDYRKATADYNKAKQDPDTDKEALKQAEKTKSFYKQSKDLKRLNAAITMASKFRVVDTTRFNQLPMTLNVQNGTVDLRTGELRQHRRTDLFNYVLPHSYVPGARNEHWEAFIDFATAGDKDVAAFLQRAIGYTLTGLANRKTMFMLQGRKNSGKSTIIEAIKEILGDKLAYMMQRETLEQTPGKRANHTEYDKATWFGKKAVLISEFNEGTAMDTTLFKSMTGGDTLVGRFPYGRTFNFRPTFVLWMGCNSVPLIDADDDPTWSRIIVFPFDNSVSPENIDPNLRNKITGPWAEAVLAWMVEGAIAYLSDEKLDMPEAVKQATVKARDSQESNIQTWINERVTFDKQIVNIEGKETLVTNLPVDYAWTQYSKWCYSRKDKPERRQKFASVMEGRFGVKNLRCPEMVKGVVKQQRCYPGITVLPIDDRFGPGDDSSNNLPFDTNRLSDRKPEPKAVH